jgi:hypothetical protein
MRDLLRYIEESNERFIDKIISIVLDDREWLEKIGIATEEVNDEKNKIAIRKQLSNPDNSIMIDSLLNYVINEYQCEMDQIALIAHYTSSESYAQHSALFAFKCSNLYFCHSIGVETTSIITQDPEDFCRTAAKTIIDYFELEKENLSDEWFKDSDVTNELTVNFDFTNIQQNP